MGVFEQLQQCLKNYEFERAFVEVLGWSRFKHVSRLELPDIGRMPRGWKTRITRARIEAAPRIQFIVRGVAKLAPQVVLHCSAVRGNYIDSLQRERLTRELAKLFYRPIIIFASADLQTQDWYFPARADNGISVVKFAADGKVGIARMAEALSSLELTVENLHLLDDHLEVFRRVSVVREELNDDPERDDELRFAMKFAQFGEWACEESKRAFRARVWDVQQQIEIGRRAKAGNPDAVQRFYDMFQYLVFERAREYLKNKHTFISEFEDYLGAGNLGVARGLGRYDPSKPYAPSTLIFFHIDKQISRAFGLLELPMWVPVHVQADMLRACWREKTAFDVLAQNNRRTPTDTDLLESLGLDEDDLEVYEHFKLSRLWDNRVSWEDLAAHDEVEDCLIYREAFDRRKDLKQLEAYLRLDAIPKRYREVLALRTGFHPAAQGDQLTLEEVSEVINVTRERARQLLMKAEDKARIAVIEPIDPPVNENVVVKEPVPRKRHHARESSIPRRTPDIESANQYVDFVLAELGKDADPNEVHRAMQRYFPFSSLKVERIIRKLEVMAERDADEEEVEQGAQQLTQSTSQVEPPIQLALVEMDDPDDDVCDQPPQPPWNIHKANAYIEHVMDTYGARYLSVESLPSRSEPLSSVHHHRVPNSRQV